MALAIEAGELMDIFKWNTAEECNTMMSEESSRQEAVDELADVLIYAIAFANGETDRYPANGFGWQGWYFIGLYL